jgi:tRNA threonylcarbamoyladenosine biosynthesis protein TsaE
LQADTDFTGGIMGRHITTSPQQTAALGCRLASSLSGGDVVAFTGALGAGKTVFCRGMAQGLGSIDAVSSPTFAIANYYRGRIPFAHFDAYRIGTTEDLETAGFFDYLNQGAVVAVEWFENITAFVPPPSIRVAIKTLDENTRVITIEGVAEL